MPTESRFPSTNAQGRLSGLYPPVRNDKTLLIGIRHRSANRHIHPVQTPVIPNRTTHKILVIPNRTYQNLLSFRRVSEAKEGGICCPLFQRLNQTSPPAAPGGAQRISVGYNVL